MFSTLSSYIWGDETQEPETRSDTGVVRAPSPDDWVLLGETSTPAPGNLSPALPPLPGDSSPAESSSASSEAGEDAVVTAAPEPAPATRQRHSTTAVTRSEKRSIKLARLEKQKNSGKALTSKSLNKHNKSLYANVSNKRPTKHNMNIKMAGANKNLKQC